MRVSAIAAMDRTGLIGDDRGLLWHLPRDLRRFKQYTLGKPIILGRKTFQLIGRPLPGRCNIVLTRDPGYTAAGCRVAHSLDAALSLAAEDLARTGNDEVMVAGGAAVYAGAADRCGRLYLTVVDGVFPGSVRFPVNDFGPFTWPPLHAEVCPPDERNRYRHCFLILDRAKDMLPDAHRRLADILEDVGKMGGA